MIGRPRRGTTRRHRRRSLLLLLVLSGAGCGRSGLPGTPRGDLVPGGRALSPPEEALLGVARRIVSAAPAVDASWPGFWPPGRSFILVAPEQATLLYLGRGSPPSFLREMRSPGPGRLYLGPDSLPDLSASAGHFDLAYPVGETTATAVPYEGDPVHTLRLLYHEGFHAFQDRAFSPRARPELAGDEAGRVPAGAGDLVEAERRMLADALAETERSAVRAGLRCYLAVREHRSRQIPPEVAELERVLERIEGTAEFAEISAAGAALGWDAAAKARALAPFLTRALRPSPLGLEWDLRQRVYGTGAAVGLLLDRLSLPWRSAVESGKSFDEVLAERLGAPDDGPLQDVLRSLKCPSPEAVKSRRR